MVGALDRTDVGRSILMGRGYLASSGWMRSAREGTAVDAQGAPRPWVTLPAIDFLEARLPTSVRVFEWGSGSSTRWWAARAAEVRSCEHDARWFERVRVGLSASASIVHVPLGEAYLDAVAEGAPWDVILIDGRDRVACGDRARAHLAPGGIVVWDDADRPRYADGIRRFEDAGFSHVEFHGPKPCSRHEHTTMVLYRSGANLLGL